MTVKKTTITYVGFGDTPPAFINFMGRKEFRRGEAVEIEDTPENKFLLKKIRGNKSFTEGKIDPKVMQDNDKKAAESAKKQKMEDARVNAREIASRK